MKRKSTKQLNNMSRPKIGLHKKEKSSKLMSEFRKITSEINRNLKKVFRTLRMYVFG